MFGTKEKEVKQEYVVKVDAARTTKNDSIIMVDLNINGVKVKSCMLKEIECKEDGKVHKKGDICYVVNFPSEKGKNGKWYSIVWCPLSNDNIDDIVKQVKSML
ncbi:MAG: hypothetical protein J6S67_24560 [Methanobrevibacter sp.]|nr:hypothetical protein [Methanobrevibacter sp.]